MCRSRIRSSSMARAWSCPAFAGLLVAKTNMPLIHQEQGAGCVANAIGRREQALRLRKFLDLHNDLRVRKGLKRLEIK